MRRFKALYLILLLSLIASLLSSCSRDPNVRKQKYFQSGQSYFVKGMYREAAIEFSNAIQIDSSYAEAHHQLAETYLKLQDGQHAAQELVRTVELQAQNQSARMELANLLIVGGDFEQAREQTDLLMKEHPEDAGVHAIVSSLLAGQGNLAGAIQEMQKAIVLDPKRWESHLTLALLQARNNEPDAAEANFKEVIELNPTAVQAYSLLGGFYQSRGRLSEAEQQFDRAIEVGPGSPEPRAALVHLYLVEGKKDRAEYLAKQAKHDFPNDPVGYRMPGDLYFTSGDLDKALAEYASLIREHQSDLHLKKDYIELLLQKGQFEEAGRLDAEILKSNPSDNDALVYRSQMQISSGRTKDAIATLETVIKNDPDNSEVHYVLGVGFQKLGNLERAQSEWRAALHLRPDLLDPVRSLAGLAMERGDMEVLDQEASEMIRLEPASPEGYALRALSNVNRKRFPAAEVDVRKAIEVSPQSSFGYVQLGNLKYQEKEFEAAGKAYQSALDRNPDSKDALRGLMNTFVAEKRVDQAISAANTQIAKSPGNSGFYDLLGTALFYPKKDLSGAATAFQKSAELDKNSSEPLLKLAQVQAAMGSTDEAIATCRGGLANHPDEPGFYILLGDLYQDGRDWSGATEAYQKALAIRPDNPMASNDLASVMLQSGGNLDVALSLAQTARRGMPRSPRVADTLGWIYYQKGAYHSAVDSLQEALRLAQEASSPDNPRLHYHLGMAYAKSGQVILARQQLQQALKLNPNSGDAENAKKQLAELKS